MLIHFSCVLSIAQNRGEQASASVREQKPAGVHRAEQTIHSLFEYQIDN
jgi:hypothetical protein